MLLNEGLIYTDQNCIGCGKCVRECPVEGVNVFYTKDRKIKVDAEKCINCGRCIGVCEHNARKYRDDINEVLNVLKQKKKISLRVSSAFYMNYPKEFEHVIRIFKQNGVANIYDVSLGADITVWAYLKYMEKVGCDNKITTQCPVMINYIEKYKKI